MGRYLQRALRGIVVLLLVASFGSARASDGQGGCGSTYTLRSSCVLDFRGFPITVFGDAVVASGTATISVTLTVQEANSFSPVVLSCSEDKDPQARYATCDRGLPDETTMIDDQLLHQFHLLCSVRSNGSGQYWCASGRGF